MFSNTLTLTIDGADHTLTRRNQDNYGSEYRFIDSSKEVVLKVRHSVDNQNNLRHDRANIFVEHRTFATPTASEKYFSISSTLRRRDGSDPATLEDLYLGVSTLVTSLISGLVQGEA